MRIASLVPSLTELLVELGLHDRLVARTGFCIHPANMVRDVPKVGGTKDVNLAKLQRLAPTHVLVNIDENRLETIEAIRAWPDPPQIVVTHPLRPEDNLALVDLLVEHFGAHADVRERAAALTRALQRELDLTRPDARPPQRVLYLIWRDPWMTVSRDTYISRTLGLCGWDTYPADADERYPTVDLAAAAPEVDRVLLSSEPYRFRERHVPEVVAAARGAEVALIDGEMVSWYGSRAIRGLRYLTAFTAA
jgi:ABC-type Fe3+-hydroxamate transport system substrate-binding protein